MSSLIYHFYNAFANSQAHLQFAQASAQTKNCKRACLLPPLTLPPRKKTNFSKDRENGMPELKNISNHC
jgi:hypothetical protein